MPLSRTITTAVITMVLITACQRQAEPAPVADAATEAPAKQAPQSTSAATPAAVNQRVIQHRAAEAVIWGMPAVNYDLMRQQMLSKTSGKENQVIYWGRPLDWHNQTLTPNPDTIYLMTFMNTRETGPMVLEIPPADNEGSINANIVNVWQMPLEDAGAHGIDEGRGIKLLLLPPDHHGQTPPGYSVLRPGTFGSYALIRSTLSSHSDADVAKSVAYAKRVRIYPLSEASAPAPTVFTDVADIDFDSTIRYDLSFYENLDRVVQQEPWLGRDSVMIDQLKSLGIEKGKPFVPDQQSRPLLEEGIHEAQQYLAGMYDRGFPVFYPGTHWMMPADPGLIKAAQTGFSDPEQYPIDARGLAYTYAYIGIKRMGAGQFYLIATKDRTGATLNGDRMYRLHVPANAPIEQYWSLTIYDRQSHALIRNVSRASRASNNQDLQKNSDGSVDIFIGPQPPAGKQNNWIPTDPQRSFEVMFRAYGPTKAFMEKQWQLSDMQVLP